MRHKWKAEDYFPPGFPQKPWENFILIGYIFCLLFSGANYLIRLWAAHGNLFDDSRQLLPGVVMEQFGHIVRGSFPCFALLAISMLALMAANLRYHYQGSKSIYLMRRLPKRWELYRRCLVLPAAVILVSLASAFLLLAAYYRIYLTVTPPQCLPPNQWLHF